MSQFEFSNWDIPRNQHAGRIVHNNKRVKHALAGPPSFAFIMISAIAIASIVLAGCHSQPSLTPQQAEGQRLYEVRCAHCHRDNDLALKKVPPDLHGLFDRTKLPSGAPATDAQVTAVVLNGKGMMPAFNGRFTQDQMSALLAYLHTGLR